MNGSSTSSPELPLPIPSPEQGVQSAEAPRGVETKSGATDGMSQGPSTPMPMVDPSQFTTAAPVSTGVVSQDQVDQVSADDEDVIEKEWVSRQNIK